MTTSDAQFGQDYQSFLDTANAVQGLQVDERLEQSRIKASCYQEGLEDAKRGRYDKYSFHPDRPLEFEQERISRLKRDLAAAVARQVRDESAAQHLVAGTRAAAAEADLRLQQARKQLAKAEQDTEEHFQPLTDRRSPHYLPDAEELTDPASALQKPAKSPRTGKSSSKGFWLIVGAALAEGAMSYLAAKIMREDPWATAAFTAVLTLITVAIPWQSAKLLRVPGRLRTFPKIASLVALGLLTIVVLGAGWMRYVMLAPNLADSLTGSESSGTNNDIIIPADGPGVNAGEVATLPAWAAIIVFLLCIALPLGVAATILLIELSDKSAQLRQGHALRAKCERLRAEVVGLTARNVHAQYAAANAEHNFDMIPVQTRSYIRALPALVADEFHAYINGLARGMSNPTITAHLQECTQHFHARFDPIAQRLVDEHLELARTVATLRAPLRCYIDEATGMTVTTSGVVSPDDDPYWLEDITHV